MLCCLRSAATLLALLCASLACGQFDASFGVDGHASAGFAPKVARATGSTVVTASGTTYLIGTAREPDAVGLTTAIAVARLTPAGTLDPAFGGDGRASFPITPAVTLVVRAALDSNERLLLVVQASSLLTVMRVRTDGTLDPDFGAGGVAVVADAFPTGPYMYPVLTDIAVDGSDRIVVLTSMRSSFPPNGWDALVLRLTDAGMIDGSFGAEGATLLAYGTNYIDEPQQMVLDPGGGIYVGMQSGPAAGGGPIYWDALIVKLDPGGHVDQSYGSNGIARLPAVTGENLLVRALATDAANRIYMLVNDVVYSPFSNTTFVARFDGAGALDASFGNGGRLAPPAHPSAGFNGYSALGLDGAGSLVLQFNESTYAAPLRVGLLRMSAAGALDQGFGLGGVIVDTSPGVNEGWNPLRIDPQRGVIVAGTLDPPDHINDLIAFRVPLAEFARIDLASSSPFATQGASLKFTATPNLAGLAGAFEFRADGLVIAGCSAVALAGGTANCVTATLPIGAHAIVVRYINDPARPDYHSPPIEQVIKPAGITLDVDGDGVSDLLTDGLLVVRYLNGLRDDALVAGALGEGASRGTGGAVADYLSGLGSLLDIDGDGLLDASRDGLLVTRYLLGVRGEALVADGVAPQGRRRSAPAIEIYLSNLLQ